MLDKNSQWYKNKDLNSLSWRDAFSFLDDWVNYVNHNETNLLAERMRNFYESTQKYWLYSDGTKRSMWMSPSTIYNNSIDIHNKTIAKEYFSNATEYYNLRVLKAEVDKVHMFNHPSTILPINLNHY